MMDNNYPCAVWMMRSLEVIHGDGGLGHSHTSHTILDNRVFVSITCSGWLFLLEWGPVIHYLHLDTMGP